MREIEKLGSKESAELEEVSYSGSWYAVRIGPAYMSREPGDRIQLRKATVDGVDLEFETRSPSGLKTNLGVIQRAAI